MALDLQNQDLAQLLMALGGFSGDNQLTQPPLQSLPATEPQQPPMQGMGDLNQQFLQQQALPPEQAAQMSFQNQPQQQLGNNIPQDFSGMGLGQMAPEVNQAQPQFDIEQLMAILQSQGLNPGAF